MAEKKAPSGRKTTAASRGKAAKSEAKTDGRAQSGVEKSAEGAPSVAKGAGAKSGAKTGTKTADAKTGSRKSATAAKVSGPATASPDFGAPARDAAQTPSVETESSDKDTPSEPSRTTIPASGPKSSSLTSPIGTASSAGNDAAKVKMSETEKTAATPAEDGGTAPTVSPTQNSMADTLSAKTSDAKPASATPADDKLKTAGTAAAAVSQGAPSKPNHPQTAHTTAAPPQARKGGFLAMLLGGVCAAAIGFGAAYYLFPQLGIMSPDSTANNDVAAALADQSERIKDLDARIDAIPGAPDTSDIEAGQADMTAQMSDLSEQVNALTARLGEIEEQPAGPGGEGVTSGQLTELRRTLKAQGNQIERLVSQADQRDNAARASAQQDLRRAALTRIRTALDTGTPFAPALGDLERAGMSAPDALQEVAEVGVPTQNALQQSFAPAARAALATARKSGDEAGNADFWSFMSGQLGARSLERREGPGADAVLSRAEDDLRQGDLNAALTEVEALPEPARAALSDWAQDARNRMQALAAYDALAAKLN